MKLLTILLIAIAANLDNLGISIAYGLRANRISFRYNFIISFISTVCAFISIFVGGILSEVMSKSTSNLVGGILLIGLGLWVVMKSSNPSNGSEHKIGSINWKGAVVLGFILAFNCLSIGFSAGVTGVEPLSTALAIGLFSFISISIGVRLGEHIGTSWLGKRAEPAGGILLIVIGLFEMFI
ncbi:manganese efflux pump [Sporosarcina sp. ACRSL]|uniref:manganese efflux pump MntP n=1 Tax=Sporosarcina sp. ACRSL TaxID=2918215 RepID=UPI001EF566EA|nr:manganese efflux pump [Sporosarcina sp. ACRSL]MCG7346484.1 manganese efflux pump [Sporosarcina sp. ACRSL]